MLLIISSPRDDSVHTVRPKLEERGVPLLWWDEAEYPGSSTLTTAFLDGRWRQTLTFQGETYDLSKVTAVWDRRPGKVAAPGVREPSQRAFAEHVARIALAGAYDLMAGARWMPAPPPHVVAVDNKLLHLHRATELGFTVADTVVTNDPQALAHLWNRAGGRVITKTLDYRPFFVDGEDRHLFTTVVPRRRLAGRHRYVFLELNVNGQWAFVEMLTGLPISDAIADWLADAATIATARPRIEEAADVR
ncbi:MvdC/MvdD family ATP grasp protein [Nonomuraea sp. NPDC003707]